MKSAGIILPNQLFKDHEILRQIDTAYLVEETLFFHQFKFHKLKLAYHRATMKRYADKLQALDINVEYIDSISPNSDVRKLIEHLSSEDIGQVTVIDPVDDWLERRIKDSCESSGLKLDILPNPGFITPTEELEKFFHDDKKFYFQTTFYKQQRKNLGILVNEKNEPLGGKWSFDSANRKPYPKNRTLPTTPVTRVGKYWDEASAYVIRHFPDNPGALPIICPYPITYTYSNNWLKDFLKNRFDHFGDYEDAIVSRSWALHHSVLTPMLNIGLLTPKEIITKALETDVPLNSLEGFIRQVIGWREFIRGIYKAKGRYSRTRNFWGFTRKIPESFYTGDTGILPIDNTVKKVLETGYCHHIERLMVLGNFMLLCEFDPDEVYTWFMEMFIDAYDWVMVPNVYGMSQFADGGLFATKPYISGSNYILKMSDYKPGPWKETWDGLFWRFLNNNRKFAGNPRLNMLIGTFDKMSADKRNNHLKAAELYLESLG